MSFNARLWEEGKYVDMWSIPHILSGVIMAGLFNWLGIGFWLNLLLSTALMIGWEFFELFVLGVHEHMTNKVMDVVTGLLGFFTSYSLINKYSVTPLIPYLIFVIIIYAFLNTWGYLSYKRRVNILP
jgi:hypothetical protein